MGPVGEAWGETVPRLKPEALVPGTVVVCDSIPELVTEPEALSPVTELKGDIVTEPEAEPGFEVLTSVAKTESDAVFKPDTPGLTPVVV